MFSKSIFRISQAILHKVHCQYVDLIIFFWEGSLFLICLILQWMPWMIYYIAASGNSLICHHVTQARIGLEQEHVCIVRDILGNSCQL